MTASPWKAGRLVALALVIGLGGLACESPTDQTPLTPERPSLQQAAPDNTVPGQYIVVFEPEVRDVAAEARALAARHGARLLATYGTALKGFAAANLSERAAQAIAGSPQVAYVEPDRRGGIVGVQSPATWGIDRIDQRNLPLSGSYAYNNDGSGAHVYILDTGIRLSHNEFGGRAKYVPNGSNGDFVADGHGSAADCHGHGTHVAGTVGGATWGVAQGTNLWAARVVDCIGSGYASMLLDAINWVTANAERPAVVNMSLGYGDVQSIRDAVNTSALAGINHAVAAGNGFFGFPMDACTESPAGAERANTVGATDRYDAEASFSNYGYCVDLLAPGVAVTSADYNSTSGSVAYSGTSMASPHVAGAIALYLTANPSASPAQISNALKVNASANKITFNPFSDLMGGTPNLLLYTAFIGEAAGGGGGGEPNSPPVASFTFDCVDLSCEFDGTGSSDPDGDPLSYSWAFGDDQTGTGATVGHGYDEAGSYSVTLTVDDGTDTHTSEPQVVTVTAPPPPPPPPSGISLSVTGYKAKGRHAMDLNWSGATSANVDVWVNGVVRATTANDGAYTHSTDNRGQGSYNLQVCEAGTATCSNVVTVVF